MTYHANSFPQRPSLTSSGKNTTSKSLSNIASHSRTQSPLQQNSKLGIYIDVNFDKRTRPSPIYAPDYRPGSSLRYCSEKTTFGFDDTKLMLVTAMGGDSDLEEGNEKELVSEEEAKYPEGATCIAILLSLCLSVLLMALDNSIIATAIPKITDEFASLADVGWYGTAYLLATASLQLLFGKFYTFFSIKIVYITTIVIFEIGSLICAAAPSSTILIVGRAIAGAGGAGIFSGALVILAYTVPIEKRPMYAGYVGSVWGISSLVGPLLGGIFADVLTWRWCFWINIPIGAMSLTSLSLCFKDPKRSTQTPPFCELVGHLDLLGNMLFIPSIITLLLALEQAGTSLPWSSLKVIRLLVASGVLFSLFLALQMKLQDKATIPPRIMKKRTVWAAALFTFSLGAAYVMSVYYLPIYFQAVKGTTALESGLMNLPLLLIVVAISIVVGMGVTKTGYFTPFMVISSVCMASGYSLFQLLDGNSNPALWIGVQLLAGTGVGSGLQLPVMVVQSVLDMNDVATGTAVMVFLQTLGGAVFVAVGQSVFSQILTRKLKETIRGIEIQKILRVGATKVKTLGSESEVKIIIGAYNEALRYVFLVCAIAAAVSAIGSLASEWRNMKEVEIKEF